MPTQARAIRTRAAILDAAALVFARRGYEAASFGDLIAESGLTKGAFYHHFSSKEALALATMEHKQAQLMEAMGAAVPETARGLERLAALLRARAAALAADESLWCVLRLGGELPTASETAARYAPLNEWPIDLFTSIVRDGQAVGDVRADLDPRAVAEAVFASVIGMDALALQLTRGADLAARTEDLLDLLRDGLAAPARPRTPGRNPR